jgi:hypothetical protein
MKEIYYINDTNNKKYTQQEFQKKVSQKAKKIQNNKDDFDNFLFERYRSYDIFFMTTQEKEKVMINFQEWCLKLAEEILLDQYYHKVIQDNS